MPDKPTIHERNINKNVKAQTVCQSVLTVDSLNCEKQLCFPGGFTL